MIRLKDLLIEEITDADIKIIVQALTDAEKIILKSIKRNDILSKGKIKWITKSSGKYPGHIEFQRYSGMDENAFVIQLKVIVEDYEANIYVKGFVDRKGDIVFKGNVFEGASKSEIFKDDTKLYRYLQDEISNFQFIKRIKQ